MLSRSGEWLKGRLVVELGGRIAVGACGSILSEAGATVVYVEARSGGAETGKFSDRALFSAGKRSLAVDPGDAGDAALLERLVTEADIVITSSDWDFFMPPRPIPDHVAVCNFTAVGPDSGQHGLTEPEVQALAGVAHTSGFPDGGPVVLRIPVLEYSAAVFGAAACVASLIATRRGGSAQKIEVSLFDCAIHLLASFLPSVFQGEDPGRLGNAHPLAAPWNAYPSSDGWLLFCTASDIQWQKFCEIAGLPEVAANAKLKLVAERARNRAEVDAIVSAWTRQHDTRTCIELLAAAGLAGGEIVTLARLPDEANVRFRQSIATTGVPGTERTIRLPKAILAPGDADQRGQPVVPAVDADRAWLMKAALASSDRRQQVRPDDGALPLAGVRVIEIGQFTTAPLSARHLAMYGAEIVKIEPMLGDAARAWAPLVDGVSMFFSMSNSGKRCCKVDLRSPAGIAQLEELVRHSDVLVENLKSGSLAALGLSPARMRELNSRLIYCPITGFGDHSAYPGRPAFDTVVQAMSGIMDANAVGGMPLKAGVSVCDVMGGEVALFAIMAALLDRDSSGKGAVLDLSMQDVAIWVTARLWNSGVPEAEFGSMVKCGDGYVLVMAGELPREYEIAGLGRDATVSLLRGRGARCMPVRTIAEALNSDVGHKLRPVIMHSTASGAQMPLLAPPVAMSRIKLRSGAPPGEAVALDAVPGSL